MVDEEKNRGAIEQEAPDTGEDSIESAVTMESAPASSPEETKLRLLPSDEATDDALRGSLAESVSSDEGDEGAVSGKKGLAGLFGSKDLGDEGDAAAAKWSMPEPRSKQQGGSIQMVNRVLVAAVVLILLFGVLDLFATIRQPPGKTVLLSPAVPQVEADHATAGSPEEGIPLLANLLESFSKQPIVKNLDRGGGETTVQIVQTRTKAPDWKVRAQKLDLIGLSPTSSGEMEAIVEDGGVGRMYILKMGQEMVVGDVQFKLVRIATDHVCFEKDGEEIIVK